MGRDVLVRANFRVPVSGPCKRCLKPVPSEEAVELTRTYVPESRRIHRRAQGEASEGSFDPGLVDEDTYSGKEVDVLLAVREQILLYIPSSPLCREDCPGLCPSCGKDLNEGECAATAPS